MLGSILSSITARSWMYACADGRPLLNHRSPETSSMASTARSINIPVESETAASLREADDAPVTLVVDGTRYRVIREQMNDADDIWAGYDPQKAIDGMRAAAGSWKDIDAEALKADIRRWREVGSREPSAL